MEAERHAKASPFNGTPPVEVLDLSSGWDSLAKFDIVIQRLKELDLYQDDLLFCPARWEEIEQLGFTQEGKDDRHVQAATEAYIRDPLAGRNLPREMCELSDSPALIVFEGYMFDGGECRYYPDPEAAEEEVGLRDVAVIIFLLTSDDFS